jgi:hypothetical protein
MLLNNISLNLLLVFITRKKQNCLRLSLIKKDNFHTSAIILNPPKQTTNINTPEIENENNQKQDNLNNLNNLEIEKDINNSNSNNSNSNNSNSNNSNINNNNNTIQLIEFDSNTEYPNDTNNENENIEEPTNYNSDSDIESDYDNSHLTDKQKFKLYDDLNQAKAFYRRLPQKDQDLHDSLYEDFIYEGLFKKELNSSRYKYVEGTCLPDLIECEEELEKNNPNDPEDSNPGSNSGSGSSGSSSFVTPSSDSNNTNNNNNGNNINSESIENNNNINNNIEENILFNYCIKNLYKNYLTFYLEFIFTILPIISKKLIHLLLLLF